MKTLAFLIVASSLIAGSLAQARIRETYEQVLARSQHSKEVVKLETIYVQDFVMLDVQAADGTFVRHVFGRDRVAIQLSVITAKPLTAKDVRAIQALYETTWNISGDDPNVKGASWMSTNG